MKRPWIGGEDFFNFHGTRRANLKSLEEKNFWVSSSCVIFLGKGRKGMKSLGRWWEGESGLDVWGTLKNISK